MKLYFKWLALGLASTLLLTACGAVNTRPATATNAKANGPINIDESELTTAIAEKYSVSAPNNNEVPSLLPLLEGEDPISTLSIKDGKYPDPLRADLGLWDHTDDVWYMLDDVFPNNFIINRDHLYTVRLWLHSDGDVIKNIRVEAQLPNTESNPQGNCIRFVASDDETGQLLLSARFYMETEDGETFEIHPFVTESALNYGGILIGDIDNEPTDIGFEFSVSHLE